MAPAVRIGVCLILGLITILLSSCDSGPRVEYSGTWVGHRTVEVRPGTPEDVRRSLEKTELVIKPQGTFALYDRGMSREGAFERSGTGGRLVVQTVMGQRVSRLAPDAAGPLEYRIEPQTDGTLRIIEGGNEADSAILKRDSPVPESQPRG